MTYKTKWDLISALIGAGIGLALGLVSTHYQEQRRLEEQEILKQYIEEERESQLAPAMVVAGVEEVEINLVGVPQDEEQDLESVDDIVDMTDEELDLLAHIVEAEAGNQSFYGKQLVVDVVFNRVESEDFPNTITEVIEQDDQFTSYMNGYYTMVEPSEDTYKAIALEYDCITNTEVFFFRTEDYHAFGNPLFVEGDHYFSGLEDEDGQTEN